MVQGIPAVELPEDSFRELIALHGADNDVVVVVGRGYFLSVGGACFLHEGWIA